MTKRDTQAREYAAEAHEVPNNDAKRAARIADRLCREGLPNAAALVLSWQYDSAKLRAERQHAQPSTLPVHDAEAPRTVRVRIAVAVDHTGEYKAVFRPSSTVEADPPAALVVAHRALNGPCVHACWIEADVPLPQKPQTIRGEVVK